MALLEKVDRALTVLEDLSGAFEQFLDGVISLEPEEEDPWMDEDDEDFDAEDDEEEDEEPKKKRGKK